MNSNIFFPGFLFFVLVNNMSYKFLAGVATGYIFSHREEFSEYRNVIEPYTDPYLDMAAEKVKHIKKTFDEVSKEKVVIKESSADSSFREKIFGKSNNN